MAWRRQGGYTRVGEIHAQVTQSVGIGGDKLWKVFEKLQMQPASDQVLSIVSADTGEVSVSPATWTIKNSNRDTPQGVTITGVDDDVVDGDQATMIKASGFVPSDSKDDTVGDDHR